jgi:hypothetical protein
VTKYITPSERHSYFGRNTPVLCSRVEDIPRWASRLTSIKSIRRKIVPIGTYLKNSLLLFEAVFTFEGGTAAELAGPLSVRNQFVGETLDGILGLGDFHRRRGHIGKHVRMTVSAVCPRSTTPSTCDEFHVDEWGPVCIVASD